MVMDNLYVAYFVANALVASWLNIVFMFIFFLCNLHCFLLRMNQPHLTKKYLALPAQWSLSSVHALLLRYLYSFNPKMSDSKLL